MREFDISVIIPTCNRENSLAKVLTLFGYQTYPYSRFEVIVVDDGSVDNTENIVKELQSKLPYRLSYIKQKNAGPASARNRGLRQAQADILLFTGDDILPKNDLIEQHLESHKQYQDVAVLGYVGWSDELNITDFMHYIAPDGFQFRYGSIKDTDNCGFRHFYTSNISLAKKWFIEDLFDEDFPYAALEDTELAYRLEKKGLKIILNKKAISYHYHQTSEESFCYRMRLTGFSASILLKKHPELKPILLPVHISIAKLISKGLKRTAFIRKINHKYYWCSQIIASYIDGIEEGLR